MRGMSAKDTINEIKMDNKDALKGPRGVVWGVLIGGSISGCFCIVAAFATGFVPVVTTYITNYMSR